MEDKSVAARLASLGLQLPAPPQPVGRYRPWIIAGDWLLLSGQFPLEAGKLRYCGRVGAELSVAEGVEACRLAALNVLAQIQSALNGFDRLVCLGRVEGYVSSAPGWFQQPQVLDAASALFHDVLGKKGEHVRGAHAPERLPLDAAVKLMVTAVIAPK